MASGDACATFHSACAAGDADGHWPVFKTIAESAYANGGSMWQGTGSNAMELEPLFLAAVAFAWLVSLAGSAAKAPSRGSAPTTRPPSSA